LTGRTPQGEQQVNEGRPLGATGCVSLPPGAAVRPCRAAAGRRQGGGRAPGRSLGGEHAHAGRRGARPARRRPRGVVGGRPRRAPAGARRPDRRRL